MSGQRVSIGLWTNNPTLERYFLAYKSSPDIKFEKINEKNITHYLFAFVDLSHSLENISQQLIALYEQAKVHKQKLVLAVLHGETIDKERNIYFSNLLNTLGRDIPIHRYVIVKDLYSADFSELGSPLEIKILQVLNENKIRVSKNGRENHYPLLLEDFVEGLKKIFYLTSTAGNTFWLIGEPVNELDIAYLYKKYTEQSGIDNFEIDSSKNVVTSEIDINFHGNQTKASLNWHPGDYFERNLKNLVKKYESDSTSLIKSFHKTDENVSKNKVAGILFNKIILIRKWFKHTKKAKESISIENIPQLLSKIVEFTLLFITAIVLLMSVSFIGFTSLSLKALEKSLTEARNGDISNSAKSLKQSINLSKVGEISYSAISPMVSIVSSNTHTKNFNLFIFLSYAHSSLENLQQTYILADKIYSSINTDVSDDFYTDASLALKSNLSEIYENLNQLELLTGPGKLPLVLESKIDSSDEFKNLRLIEQQIAQVMKSVELIPSLFGSNGVKNIFVVFQNSKELRSTGGAIDYILAIVLEKRRLVSQNTYLSTELDKFVEGVVQSPPTIESFTGSEDWNFRDLNYNPDYPQTAVNISWLIEKALKIKPDVIITVSDILIRDLLSEDPRTSTGGVTDVIKNLDDELIKNTPSPLYKTLIEQYAAEILNHNIPINTLGRVAAKQSESHHILYWTSNELLEKSIIGQPYSGAVYNHACLSGLISTVKCIAQTTYLNESIFSNVPLGDRYIRSVLHNIQIETMHTRHQYKIHYEFNENLTQIADTVNMVIQLYAPLSTELGQINLDGMPISLSGLIEQDEGTLKRYQFPITMSTAQSHDLVINFVSVNNFPAILPFSYSITEYRQPGNSGKVELNIIPPSQSKASVLSSPAQITPDGLSITLPVKNTTFGVSFIISE